MSQADRIAAIEAGNRQLRQGLEAAVARNALLLQRVQELEARLAKDSHNSGKPPSSGGLARQTHSLSKKSGKKPGGQMGHHGETLRLVHLPDEVIEHRPGACAACQAPLEGAPMVLCERRQVHDLPQPRQVILGNYSGEAWLGRQRGAPMKTASSAASRLICCLLGVDK